MRSEVLLMRHDVSDGRFPVLPWTGADWALNKHDPSAKQFSRMDELDDYLGEDEVYNFKSGSSCIVEAWLNSVLHVSCTQKTGCVTLGARPQTMTTASYLTRPVIPGNLNTAESVCVCVWVFKLKNLLFLFRTGSSSVGGFVLHHTPAAYPLDCVTQPNCQLDGLVSDSRARRRHSGPHDSGHRNPVISLPPAGQWWLCLDRWQRGLCDMFFCTVHRFAALLESATSRHLRGTLR